MNSKIVKEVRDILLECHSINTPTTAESIIRRMKECNAVNLAPRELRYAIHEIRTKHMLPHPITVVSGNDGYYVTSDISKINEFMERMYKQIQGIKEIMESMPYKYHKTI